MLSEVSADEQSLIHLFMREAEERKKGRKNFESLATDVSFQSNSIL